jgi:hypothetical protein
MFAAAERDKEDGRFVKTSMNLRCFTSVVMVASSIVF